MRLPLAITLALLATQAQATGLEDAMNRYPPLIIGANTDPVAGPVAPRACPPAGSVVEQKGAPAFEYLGASSKNPNLCHLRLGPDTVDAWYGIWLTSWPGADQAYPALTRAMQRGTGAIEAFDTVMSPGYAYHDVIRNEGVETINLLGAKYQALKISHYREGFEGNTYRSVSTIWKDIPSGLLIYGTYQHISGTPELDDPLIPTRIAPQLINQPAPSAR